MTAPMLDTAPDTRIFDLSAEQQSDVDSMHAAIVAEPEGHPLSLFEFWPGFVFYTPIVLYWIAMGIRYGDFSVPTAANPRIETGGLCGESKSAILDMAGQIAKPWIAAYATFTTGRGRDDEGDLSRAHAAMDEASLFYPVVVKPDIGCNGTGVKLVEDEAAMKAVLARFPRGVGLMVQALIDAPIEAGLFYIRHPDEPRGRITSVTYKEAPILTGDGSMTLRDLLHGDPRTKLVPHLYLPRLEGRLNDIPASGERVRLVFAGNHCKGSIFRNGADDITDALTDRLDQLMKDVPDFHFGRIDVKATSTAALRRGEGFQIIEINGVGSEATHIWDRRTTLREAYRAQFFHYRETFRIGAAKRRAGWKTWGAFTMLRYWIKQRRLLASYPLND